ncbi:MAG: DNA-3-methyladenine glycosylase [Clostridiales bacterium]|nr:DNA-3-methyladenine glycosylase [Clostridiales bacterium]
MRWRPPDDHLEPLPEAIWALPTLELAQELLGRWLVHETPDGLLVGRIVETEAYMGPHDRAAHSYGGKVTPRTRVMYGPPGHAYVYFIYGMYDCLNVVAAQEGIPHAILIRAVEPLVGGGIMARLRGLDIDRVQQALEEGKSVPALTSGPGRLTQAFGITRENHNGHDLRKRPLYIAKGTPYPPEAVAVSERIGIDYAGEARHYLWRFFIAHHPYVTKPRSGIPLRDFQSKDRTGQPGSGV